MMMPAPPLQPRPDTLSILRRFKRHRTPMSQVIAVKARSNDICRQVATAILASAQMLCSASQAICELVGKSISVAKEIGIVEPHRCAAIKAAAVLPIKRGTS
jgi:hypothetical protein